MEDQAPEPGARRRAARPVRRALGHGGRRRDRPAGEARARRRHREELAEARRPHGGAGRLARAAAERLLQDRHLDARRRETRATSRPIATRGSMSSPAATTIRTATRWPETRGRAPTG